MSIPQIALNSKNARKLKNFEVLASKSLDAVVDVSHESSVSAVVNCVVMDALSVCTQDHVLMEEVRARNAAMIAQITGSRSVSNEMDTTIASEPQDTGLVCAQCLSYPVNCQHTRPVLCC
jgi:hypothetical protein